MGKMWGWNALSWEWAVSAAFSKRLAQKGRPLGEGICFISSTWWYGVEAHATHPQWEGNSLSHFTLPAGWNPLSVQQAKRTDIRMLRKEFAIHMNVNYGNGKRGK